MLAVNVGGYEGLSTVNAVVEDVVAVDRWKT